MALISPCSAYHTRVSGVMTAAMASASGSSMMSV
jgi:hypothetical protein